MEHAIEREYRNCIGDEQQHYNPGRRGEVYIERFVRGANGIVVHCVLSSEKTVAPVQYVSM
jgi:hypothetical protein